MKNKASTLLKELALPLPVSTICHKIIDNKRITPEEALELYNCSNLALIGLLAMHIKYRHSASHVYFNKNFHIEPTNICIKHCKFCSYRRKPGQKGAWEYSIGEMVEIARKQFAEGASEAHIVGGVHPGRDVYFYIELIKAIKQVAPGLHIKAFTAVEIGQMCKMAGLNYHEGLRILKEAGLGSMPGGGAEIFDETLRAEICPDKTSSDEWLDIHKTAHELGIPTNATILYGLKENYIHRVDHMDRLRSLQDKTNGFNTFIPLKFKHYNNYYSHIEETTIIEDMKNFAVSRIFLDNIPHLKAYWPMIGKQAAQLSLAFGVDDLDGTIDDSTRIYSMAGSEEQSPKASTSELIELIKAANMKPVLRDTLYNIIESY